MIGYYVHHHGRGHLARASCVAAEAEEPVVALSSLPEPDGHPFASWVGLPPDPALEPAADARAGGTLHWAPLDSAGYRNRMADIAEWVAAHRPRLMVVDVSVEVTALVRLLAVPVVVVAGPGLRDDAPHLLAHRMATRVLAPWPALDEPSPWCRTGAFSRFDHHVVPPPAAGSGRVLVLLGAGGAEFDPDALRQAADDTGWAYGELGGTGRWVDDPWDELLAADVVVTHAGLGALAEVSAARRPAVVLPQPRPFGEQDATAARLARAGLAEVPDRLPSRRTWPAVLDRALGRGGAGWARWNDGGGAARFVGALTGIGR